jgi:crossover junction endodeoxyribonuclease RusA
MTFESQLQERYADVRGTIDLTLPWPHKDLSPNARVHWAHKSGLTKNARHTAWALTAQALRSVKRTAWEAVQVTVAFCPPDKRRRDRDNLIASLKASNDGISDALGIDDSKFISTYSMGEVVKGGCVKITLSEAVVSVRAA